MNMTEKLEINNPNPIGTTQVIQREANFDKEKLNEQPPVPQNLESLNQ